MDNESEVVKVEVPQKEASALCLALRKELPNVPLSVYAEIRPGNLRALHVAADDPEDSTRRFDARYKADKPTDRLAANAVKRIRAAFALV